MIFEISLPFSEMEGHISALLEFKIVEEILLKE